MNKAPLIGIIDSGVTTQFNDKVHLQRSFFWQDEQVITSSCVVDKLGHGSAIADVIIKQLPDVELAIAQVFHEKLVTTPAQIAAAIDWLIEQKVSVINMSFGLHNDREVLKQACQRAIDKGIFLVGSSPAQGKPVYPSAYRGVLRATGDARCRPNEFSWLNSTQADYGGCVRSSLSNVVGASVGTAYMTGHIARYLSIHNKLAPSHLFEWLNKQAKYWGAEDRFALRASTKGELNKEMIIPDKK